MLFEFEMEEEVYRLPERPVVGPGPGRQASII
jgi:hypothetical protein